MLLLFMQENTRAAWTQDIVNNASVLNKSVIVACLVQVTVAKWAV